ncbi:MAG: hypothetical protein GY731_00975 [Gammaproteobacteria bacterium]|nr:hypothetical protein [Gammaproteobacteria bacterium]
MTTYRSPDKDPVGRFPPFVGKGLPTYAEIFFLKGIVRRTLDKYIIPQIGEIPPEDLHPRHIDTTLRNIVDKGAPTVANDALRYIKRILAYARKRRVITHNVAADFDMSDAGGKEETRTRRITKLGA